MQLKHGSATASASFDDPNLVSSAGLVPIMALAEKADLRRLAQKWLSVPTDKGANAGLKVASLVAGMVAGADSIDDMAFLRHGGMAKLFTAIYAPSTLGSFLRKFAFGHVRQLDAVAWRFLVNLTGLTGLFTTAGAAPAQPEVAGTVVNAEPGYVFLDVTTQSLRSTAIRSRAPAMGIPGCAASTPSWPSCRRPREPRSSSAGDCGAAPVVPHAERNDSSAMPWLRWGAFPVWKALASCSGPIPPTTVIRRSKRRSAPARTCA